MNCTQVKWMVLGGLFSSFCELSYAQEYPIRLPDMIIEGRADSLVGVADSATQGTVGTDQLQLRPTPRTGELLETVPGVIITQHAGGGKANQYFLRGFNLDHGTDFTRLSMECR